VIVVSSCVPTDFASINCFREFVRAVTLRRPITALVEIEPTRGALTRDQIYQQIERRHRFEPLL
jgi:hypothetical protein